LNVNCENFNIKCDIIKTYEDLLELIWWKKINKVFLSLKY
jgi:hypothetical protein